MSSTSVYDKIKPYLSRLNINGMHGRMLKIPAKNQKKREILLIYGHHSSLERMFGIADHLSEYGSVTLPDLPGFGGMESFYKIGMKPTLDNMADYLATFIKLRYKNKKITIIGMSLGFVIATRMLQRSPKLASQIELLVSVVGFCHKEDYKFTKTRYWFYRLSTSLFARRLPAAFFYNVVLHPMLIRTFYSKTKNAKAKFAGLSPEDRQKALDFEVYLWRCNEVRTYMYTATAMLTLDNCKVQIPLPVWHVSVSADQYCHKAVVEQHMRVIFEDYKACEVALNSHAPSIMATAEEAASLFPKILRDKLNESVG
jgi:pimeloyl-ACP methyl ester carboxylesterase